MKCISVLLLTQSALIIGCGEQEAFDPAEPTRGPSQLLPSRPAQITDGSFNGGNDAVPFEEDSQWDPTPPIACDDACLSRCDALAFENPVNRGLCGALWGPGGSGTPVVPEEACRRLWVDTLGRFPTLDEVEKECLPRPWGAVVSDLIARADFVRLNRRLWADRLRYDTEAVSVERIFDMDRLVELLYQGRLAYDHFAALVSAHPVLTRRYDTSGDRAEALFWLLLGRPPFGEERSDLGRLYALWDNNYYDHPQLGMRLPDAHVRYRCVNEQGRATSSLAGECTSIKFGKVESVVLEPDARAERHDRGGYSMWSGLLSPNEWEVLQAPGRLLSEQWIFWEHAARTVVQQYLGYKLTTDVPRVSEELVRYALAHDGDIRALHFAVLTSAPYLQSSRGDRDAKLRYTYGPLKQIDAEGWVESVEAMTGRPLSRCDLRLNRPRDFLNSDAPFAHALIRSSEWTFDEEGRIDSGYRDLVRNLGGCPDNSQGGRFKIVSVLTTANQLNHATRLCDPSPGERGSGGGRGRADVRTLLPAGVSAEDAVDEGLAAAIYTHQMSRFFARQPSGEELQAVEGYGAECARSRCNAEQFARPTCFALLSSSEMLFY